MYWTSISTTWLLPSWFNSSILSGEYKRLISPFVDILDTKKPKTMNAIQQRLSDKYFTDEKMEEISQIYASLGDYENALEKLFYKLRSFCSYLRDCKDDLEESVESKCVESTEEELVQARSYLEELSSKEMTTLLAIAEKWCPKEESRVHKMLPQDSKKK